MIVMVRVRLGFMIRVRFRIRLGLGLALAGRLGVKVRVRVSPSLYNSCQGVNDGDCEGGTSYVCEASPLTLSLTLAQP